MAQEQLEVLVVDTGALIKGADLNRLTKAAYTVQGVIDEVRDRRTRINVDLLPFELKVREPTPEAVAAVIEFSRKTGDYRSLSKTDLMVIALAYTFHKEKCGLGNIRTEPRTKPARKKRNRGNKKNKGVKEVTEFDQEEDEKNAGEAPATAVKDTGTVEKVNSEAVEEQDAVLGKLLAMGAKKEEATAASVILQRLQEDPERASLEDPKPAGTCDTAGTASLDVPEPAGADAPAPAPVSQTARPNLGSLKGPAGYTTMIAPTEDDDDGEWITSGNLANVLEKEQDTSKISSGTKVGIITTDFAMQNVILQLNLHLVSVDGLVIKQIKQFILVCYACGKTSYDMDRLFCATCGNHTMRKVPAVNQNGILTINKNYTFTPKKKGTQFNIPKNVGGRGADLILREDQMFRHKKLAKKSEDMFDLDHLTHFHGKTAKGNTATYNQPVLGFGNRSINDPRNFHTKGKKKRK